MKNRVSIKVHPATVFVMVVTFFLAPSNQVLASFAALVWHESAHLIVMLLCGVRHCTVELTPFGGMADAKGYETLSSLKQMLCAAAGIAASAIPLCMRCVLQSSRVGYAFLLANQSLFLINCLPVWPLDGSRILIAAASKLGVEYQCRKVLEWLAWGLGIGLGIIGLYGVWLGHVNVSLLLIGPYLCYAAREGTISEQVRRIQTMQDKLQMKHALPVHVYACRTEKMDVAMRIALGTAVAERYQLLVGVDPKSGRVERVVTEQEMRRLFL